MDQEQLYDVIVVGGGAAGMIAAGRAAERGKRVLLLEKNRTLGAKLAITGGGRCNITNAENDLHKLLRHYGKAEQFLYSVFSQFGVTETFSFFESHGMPLVVQARKRVFPHTEKAHDVVKTLEKYVRQGRVTVVTDAPVTRVRADNGLIEAVVSRKNVYRAKYYIFATGGISRPETGSTGDGFNWLKTLGHSVKKPTPTIVPLAVQERWAKVLAGVSLSFMKINFFVDSKKALSKTGKILFTHFGISGPLILNVAASVSDLLQSGTVTATIDAYPHTDLGALEKRVIRVFDANKNKLFKNVASEFLPEGTAKGILLLFAKEFDTNKKVHSITKEERKKIVQLLKALPLTITGLMGFDRAVIADGGVPLEEIDMKTMRSKKVGNLSVTGDLLHVNRPSGGYSLQLCWSSGWVAANAL